jgi:hypothetical protein
LLKRPSDTPLTGVHSLAIAVAGSSITGDSRQRHVAFLYRHESKNLLLLHLGWHNLLMYESWPSFHYSWLEVSGIAPDLQELFIDWVEVVATTVNGQAADIPYSAHFRPTGNFDASGHYIDKKDGTGLTCATFILAMFADYRLPLIDPASWPKRNDDFTWFRKMWGRLKKWGIREKVLPQMRIGLIEQFKQRRQLKRFRPEEIVAAGSLFSGIPLNFSEVAQRLPAITPELPK